jgi:hypothetical protein
MKFRPFEILPKQDPPDIQDSLLLVWLLPFTGIHLFVMRENKKALVRLALLVTWFLVPFIFSGLSFKFWLSSFSIVFIMWIYDLLTLRSIYEKRWGKRTSFRV